MFREEDQVALLSEWGAEPDLIQAYRQRSFEYETALSFIIARERLDLLERIDLSAMHIRSSMLEVRGIDAEIITM